MGIILWFLFTFEIINDSLTFHLPSLKAEIISLRYIGPPLPGYESTEPKLIGEVKNIGKDVIIGLRVEVTVYGDEMKLLVDKRDREVAFWIIEPQNTSPFCVYLSGGLQSRDEIKALKIDLIKQKTISDLLEVSSNNGIYDGLEVLNVGVVVETTFVYDDVLENHYIRGRIVNKGKKTTKCNVIVVLFYDKNGNLIDYRKHSIFGALAGGELVPGGARIFRLDVPSEVIKYKTYAYKLKLFSIAK